MKVSYFFVKDQLKKILIVSFAFLCISLLIMLFFLRNIRQEIAQKNTLEKAERYIDILESVGEDYTNEIEENSHIRLNQKVRKESSKTDFNIDFEVYNLSQTFKDKGKSPTVFQMRALEAISNDNSRPYYEFIKEGGSLFLHYAQASQTSPSGIQSNAPKLYKGLDQLGEILEIKLPLADIKTPWFQYTLIYFTCAVFVALVAFGITIRRILKTSTKMQSYSVKREALSEQALLNVKEERKKIAAYLHDHIGSILTHSRLSFIEVVDSIKKEDRNETLIKNMSKSLRDAYDGVKNLSHSITPEKVVQTTLKEALSELTSRLDLVSDTKFELIFSGSEERIEKPILENIYNIVEEASNNALKYSTAFSVSVQIIISTSEIIISIEDDGLGFDVQENLKEDKGLGLKNMKNRVEWFNGEFNIESNPKGTTVMAVIPYSSKNR